MMRPRRWALTLTGSLGPLLLAFVWLEAQRAGSEGGAPVPPSTPPAAIFRRHVERVRSRAGEVTWQFEADRIDLLESGDYLVYGLTHGQYLSHGTAELHCRADRARLDGRTQDITARGNIRGWSPRGIRFAADRLYWFEAEGKLVVPEIDTLEFVPPERPANPAVVQTERLFLWPREDRLELPDRVEIDHGDNHLEAAAGRVRLQAGRLELQGPAQVRVTTKLDVLGARGAAKPLVAAVAAGGTMAYNRAGGGALLQRAVTVQIPTDGVSITSDQAIYSGDEKRLVTAAGGLVVRDPHNTLRASRVVVDTKAQRAELIGPVTLEHLAGGPPTTIACDAMEYHYAAGGRRAEARGRVEVRFDRGTAWAPRADIDLEAEAAVLTGGVRLRAQPVEGPPRPGADRLERARHQPVSIAAPRLEHVFRAGARRSVAAGPVRFEQEDRVGRARRMSFDHETEVLVLEGDVRVTNSAGEKAVCQRLVYDLRQDTMSIETPASAEFFLPEEER